MQIDFFGIGNQACCCIWRKSGLAVGRDRRFLKNSAKTGSKWEFSWPHKHATYSFEKMVIPPSKLDFFQHKMRRILCFEICLVALEWKNSDFFRMSQRHILKITLSLSSHESLLIFSNFNESPLNLIFFQCILRFLQILGWCWWCKLWMNQDREQR